MPVAEGNKVKIEYTGTLEDGTVFDSTEKHGGKPLEFEVGSHMVIKGFEDAIIGMEKGDEKEIKIESKDAYGDVNPQLVKDIPKDKLPAEAEIVPGLVLAMTMPNGAQIPVKVAEVNGDNVKIDMNHPLAGKNLNFKIKLVDFS
jgi:FKBP-type peptidyl-prolyl cis-trans isomerase 2